MSVSNCSDFEVPGLTHLDAVLSRERISGRGVGIAVGLAVACESRKAVESARLTLEPAMMMEPCAVAEALEWYILGTEEFVKPVLSHFLPSGCFGRYNTGEKIGSWASLYGKNNRNGSAAAGTAC